MNPRLGTERFARYAAGLKRSRRKVCCPHQMGREPSSWNTFGQLSKGLWRWATLSKAAQLAGWSGAMANQTVITVGIFEEAFAEPRRRRGFELHAVSEFVLLSSRLLQSSRLYCQTSH